MKKALEIIDAFEKEKDLFQWYSILSMEWRVITNTRLKMKSGKIRVLITTSIVAGQVPRQHLNLKSLLKCIACSTLFRKFSN